MGTLRRPADRSSIGVTRQVGYWVRYMRNFAPDDRARDQTTAWPLGSIDGIKALLTERPFSAVASHPLTPSTGLASAFTGWRDFIAPVRVAGEVSIGCTRSPLFRCRRRTRALILNSYKPSFAPAARHPIAALRDSTKWFSACISPCSTSLCGKLHSLLLVDLRDLKHAIFERQLNGSISTTSPRCGECFLSRTALCEHNHQNRCGEKSCLFHFILP
jgi:hypothetical protein